MLVRITKSVRDEIKRNLKVLYNKKYNDMTEKLKNTPGLADRLHTIVYGDVEKKVREANIPMDFISTAKSITLSGIENASYPTIVVGAVQISMTFSTSKVWPTGSISTPFIYGGIYGGLRLRPNPAWGDIYDIFNDYFNGVVRNAKEYEEMRDQVMALLDNSPSVNKALEKWPSLGALLPQEARDNVSKATPRKVKPKAVEESTPTTVNEDKLSELGAALTADKFLSI